MRGRCHWVVALMLVMCSTRQRLAAAIRERRKEMGLTIRSAAELARIGPSTLSRWEAGTRVPMVPELEALLKTLGYSDSEMNRILVSIDAPRAAREARDLQGMNDVPTGGDLLRALRRRRRITLPMLAELLNVAPSTVSRWESSIAHPSPGALAKYLDIVEASPQERATLVSSGVGKVKSDRPAFVAREYMEKLSAISRTLPSGGHPDTELELLQMQSNLWWERNNSDAIHLLRICHVLYASYLHEWGRFAEALKEADQALASGEPFDEVGIEAQRIQAVSMVYRGPVLRPHQGLCILQSCFLNVLDPVQRVRILVDMADLSHRVGRKDEAISYAERAVESARGRELDVTLSAKGALATARDSFEELRLRPEDPWFACVFMLRELGLHATQATVLPEELIIETSNHAQKHRFLTVPGKISILRTVYLRREGV